MNESEQAQAIEEILHRHDNIVLTWENETQPGDGRDAHNDRSTLLEIVESQAQKIAELEKEIIVAKNVATAFATKCADKEQKLAQLTKERDEQTAAAYRLGVDGQEKIAEQAKEIERLKAGGLVKPGNSRMLIRNLRGMK